MEGYGEKISSPPLILLILCYYSLMSYHPFSTLPPPKPDPLFAIAAEAEKAGPAAINGTIGIFMDEEGKPLVLPSICKTLTHLQKHLLDFNYSYPLLTGLPKFQQAVIDLIAEPKDVVASIAATGGTGALALNLRLLKMLLGEGSDEIVVTVPGWVNDLPLCRWAGFKTVEAPYIIDGVASVDAIIEAVEARTKPFGILLQVGCHNPTGLDLTTEQWNSLLDALEKKQCVVLFDFAYQGFKSEPEEDRFPIGLCIDRGIPTLVSWSASKNHSIYGLRTGLAAAFVKDETEKKTVEGTYCTIVRGLHSSSPTFGQAIVALTQQMHPDEWLSDLRDARDILKRKRDLLIKNLPARFTPSLRGYGMYAMLPLSPQQVLRLKTEHKVFMTSAGRINIAGIPEVKIPLLCEKIASVL